MTRPVDLLITNGRVVGGTAVDTATSVGISDGIIVHVGEPGEVVADRVVDAGGRLVTPGLVDCHTHLVFGGQRVDEFRRRVAGATYEDIARAGGGIMSTVEATRAADEDELHESARARLSWLTRSGVTTVEIKSGYGLDAATETMMLRVARRLGRGSGLSVHATLLAAHVVPSEYRHDPDGYVDLVCHEILPAVVDEDLADSVDVFSDRIAFTPTQAERVLTAATDAGLPVRMHADQLSDQGGAALAARLGALSADHLEHATGPGLVAMAEAGTVAVLIPGASTYLDEAARPPLAAMRDAGVDVAIATDLNPGSSPLASLPLAMALACTRFGVDIEEAFGAVTVNAARALGYSDRGRLDPRTRGDVVVWHASDVAELCYWMGAPLAALTVAAGEITWSDGSVAAARRDDEARLIPPG